MNFICIMYALLRCSIFDSLDSRLECFVPFYGTCPIFLALTKGSSKVRSNSVSGQAYLAKDGISEQLFNRINKRQRKWSNTLLSNELDQCPGYRNGFWYYLNGAAMKTCDPFPPYILSPLWIGGPEHFLIYLPGLFVLH